MTNLLSELNYKLIFDLLQQFIATFASIFALYKLFTSLSSNRFMKRIKMYNLTKEFVFDLHNQESHCFVLEKGFLALTGMICSINEIKFLLKLNSPIIAVEKRIAAGDYLEFDDYKNLYLLKSFYKNTIVQKYAPILLIIIYFLTASIGIYPVFSEKILIFNDYSSILFSISFLFIALWALSAYEYFNSAKKFILYINTQNSIETNNDK